MVTGTTPFYPYVQLGHGTGGPSPTYPQGLQYPPLVHYSALNSTPFPQHYGGTTLPPPTSAGVFFSMTLTNKSAMGCTGVSSNAMCNLTWNDHTL